MKRSCLLMIVAVAGAVSIAGCGDTSAESEPAGPASPTTVTTTPRPVPNDKDPVEIWRSENGHYRVSKLCDGTTLLYLSDDYHYSIAAVPNSPECGAQAEITTPSQTTPPTPR